MIAIFVDGTKNHYTRGYNFPIRTTPKKISVSELGVIFLGSPLFLAIPTLEGQLPLILVRFQRNSGEPSGLSKKVNHWLSDNLKSRDASASKKHFLAERTNDRFSVVPARTRSVVLLGHFFDDPDGSPEFR